MADNTQRMIIHLDMDAYYASVEELDNPQLKGQAVIVGGAADQRGVVSTANYIARQSGVRSAMPMATAIRLCPQAIVVAGRGNRYREISRQIHAIFHRYTPLIEPLSLDEAFLDVNASTRLFGDVTQIAAEIKRLIFDELALTASVGIAPNKFLAKLASDAQKPNGFVVVKPEDINNFLDPLPVNRIWGIGKSSAHALEMAGIYTVAQLKKQTMQQLENLFGPNLAAHFYRLSRGIDERPIITSSVAKSISREVTFSRDIDDIVKIKHHFFKLTEDVSQRLRAKQLKVRSLKIKFRREDFKTFIRSTSVNVATDSTQAIWKNINQLVHTHIDKSVLPLRLVGVGLSNLESNNEIQSDLFSEDEGSLDMIYDQINNRFGKTSITLAASLTNNKKNI